MGAAAEGGDGVIEAIDGGAPFVFALYRRERGEALPEPGRPVFESGGEDDDVGMGGVEAAGGIEGLLFDLVVGADGWGDVQAPWGGFDTEIRCQRRGGEGGEEGEFDRTQMGGWIGLQRAPGFPILSGAGHAWPSSTNSTVRETGSAGCCQPGLVSTS